MVTQNKEDAKLKKKKLFKEKYNLSEGVVEDIENTYFFVEATLQENHFLQCRHANDSGESSSRYNWEKVSWEDDCKGALVTMSYVSLNGEKFPLCLTMFWSTIKGLRVGFYEGTSRIVDHNVIREFIKDCLEINKYPEEDRPRTTDAANFSHCLGAIKRYNSLKN